MAAMLIRFAGVATVLAALCLADLAAAAEIGQIKTAKGSVTIERDGRTLPGTVGVLLQSADVVKTGADSAVGITMDDDSLLSAGPGSVTFADSKVPSRVLM